MPRFFSAAPRRFTLLATFLGGALLVNNTLALTYDVRAQTKDKIKNALVFSSVDTNGDAVFVAGNANQGSFGAPSINDKGNVAYACILSGKGITALTNYSVAFRLKGNKPAYVAFQTGITVSNTFLSAGAPYPVADSGYIYRLGRDVAINNNNVIGYSGELIYTEDPPGTAAPFVNSVGTYGSSLPFNAKKPTTFTNAGLLTYNNFVQTIFTETMSINSRGAVPYNAKTTLSVNETDIDSFGYAIPGFISTTATAQTPVIGLPYFTTFQSFTKSIIADKNVGFVVAKLSENNGDFDGIWQGNNPNIQPVIVQNNKAPGGATFTSFAEKIGPSRNGKMIAFIATLSNGVRGVYRANKDGSSIIQIATVGSTVPTNEDSGNLGTFTSFTLAGCANSGQVAIQGVVNGKDGIWVTDTKGANLTLVAVEGESFEVKGATKSITKLAFNAVSGLNAKGQLAFTASFNDRTSAVIVAK